MDVAQIQQDYEEIVRTPEAAGIAELISLYRQYAVLYGSTYQTLEGAEPRLVLSTTDRSS